MKRKREKGKKGGKRSPEGKEGETEEKILKRRVRQLIFKKPKALCQKHRAFFIIVFVLKG